MRSIRRLTVTLVVLTVLTTATFIGAAGAHAPAQRRAVPISAGTRATCIYLIFWTICI